jgi:peptidoglycan/LPS O-acetylase OafA/YrhL
MQVSIKDALDTASEFGALRALFGFSFGVAMHAMSDYLFRSKILESHSNKTAALQFVGLGLVLWILNVGIAGNPITFLAPFIFGLFILSLAVHEKGLFHVLLTSPPFRFLGMVSYGVYMIHTLVIIVVKNIASILGFVEGSEGLNDIVSPAVGNIMLLVVAALSLFGAWVVYHVLERPFVKWGKALSAKLSN